MNKAYFESDFKIVVGNIELHQFVGFSGGVKSAAIGLAGVKTINRNHTLMAHPMSKLGEYETNPARLDVEEIGQTLGIQLALNAILNQGQQIVHVLAGEPRAVMQAGVPLSRRVCQVSLGADYGVIIASPGGYPKDINLYQAQKGLAHAVLATRPGGTVILAAACPEGSGSPHYGPGDDHVHHDGSSGGGRAPALPRAPGESPPTASRRPGPRQPLRPRRSSARSGPWPP